MIVCTRAGSDLCRNVFGKKNVLVTNIESIIESFALDPQVSQPVRDAFVIMSQDLSNTKVNQAFIISAGKKHPDVSIVVIAKNNQGLMSNVKGVDASIVRPRNARDLELIITDLINTKQSSKLVLDVDKTQEKIEDWTPQEVEQLNEVVETEEELDIQSEELTEVAPPMDVEMQLEAEEDVRHNTLVQRIRECEQVAEIASVTKELNANEILKQIALENEQYASIEEVLRGLTEKIHSIAETTNDSNLPANLNKIRALLRDSNWYKAKTNSVVEQYVEEIIDTITESVLKHLNARLDTIDATLVKLRIAGETMHSTPLVASLLDKRANVWLELAALDKEVRQVLGFTNNLASGIVEKAAVEDAGVTGVANLDARLSVYGEEARPVSTLNMMVNVLKTANRASVEFETALRNIDVISQKLSLLLGTDNAAIAAMTKQFEQMKMCKVEDSVVAKTLLKQSLRIFTGYEGTGVTAISLIISQLKSRIHNNVLLLDLSGNAKFEDYGEGFMTLDEFMSSVVDKPFCVVSGEVNTTPEALQRLVVVLNRAADYYKVINIIVSPEQKEVFEILATEVASINYIVGSSNTNIKKMATLIKETTYENMGQRIILNKCDVSAGNIFYRLGVMDKMTINTLKLPTMAEIVDASYNRVKPYMIESVVEQFREVMKYA